MSHPTEAVDDNAPAAIPSSERGAGEDPLPRLGTHQSEVLDRPGLRQAAPGAAASNPKALDGAATAGSASHARGAAPDRSQGSGRRVLMLLQNQTLPRDARVWPECLTLRAAGFEVVAICPASDRSPELYCRIEGVEIHRFPLRAASGGALGYLREYAQTMWQMARTVRRVARGRHFDVVHAANPPDLLLLAAWPLHRRGTRLIFDQHDLVPELYLSRFGGSAGALYRMTRLLERVSFRLADVVISTNESYRGVALDRGGKRSRDVFVVRNGPDLERFLPLAPDTSLRRGKRYLIVYLGVMGPQDGVDHALRALALLKRRRRDWHAVMIGAGDVEPQLRSLTAELGLEDAVEFTGWLEEADVRRYLFSADVGLAPDPMSPINDVSTLVKIGEYMAASRPVVSYDLGESRISAAGAALYATPNDEQSFADCIDALLADPGRRRAMGRAGRARVEQALSWQHSTVQLLAAYRRLLEDD